jgi:hypothetical protein
MGAIHDLLEADRANTLNSIKALDRFSPDLPYSLDEVADLFDNFIRQFGVVMDDSEELRAGNAIAEELGADAESLRELLDKEGLTEERLEEAKTIWRRLYARHARRILLLLLQRHYLWAVTDLLRMRITPALGYCRQEAEAVALLVLVRDSPNLGIRWFRVRTDEEGKAFFKDVQRDVRAVLTRLELNDVYERGSGSALHVRLASAAPALSLDRMPNAIWLGYQEVRPDEPFRYFLDVLGFLSTQVRVVRALGEAFPEITDPIWAAAVDRFTRSVVGLWERLSQQFPAECRRLEEMSAPGPPQADAGGFNANLDA